MGVDELHRAHDAKRKPAGKPGQTQFLKIPEVRAGILELLARTERAGISQVDIVTLVPDAVAVEIPLVRIGGVRAIVASIPDAVAIAVLLTRIGLEGTVVIVVQQVGAAPPLVRQKTAGRTVAVGVGHGREVIFVDGPRAQFQQVGQPVPVAVQRTFRTTAGSQGERSVARISIAVEVLGLLLRVRHQRTVVIVVSKCRRRPYPGAPPGPGRSLRPPPGRRRPSPAQHRVLQNLR